MDMWLGEKRPTGSREYYISQLLGGIHVGDPAKHGRKQSQKTEERLILPTLTQLTGQHGGEPLRKCTVQPHRVGKWTLHDNDESINFPGHKVNIFYL